MHKDTGTLNVSQEFMSKTNTLRCSLDQSRDICDNKSAILSIYHTKVRTQCCEVIIGDLWLCIGDSGKESGFADIRESYKSYVCDHLKFQKNFQLLCRLSRLCILRNLHGCCRIMLVSFAASSSFEHDLSAVFTGHIRNDLA